jgi:hypothetical protein
MRKSTVAALITALLVGGGSATAAKLISSGDIKNGTIRKADVRKGSLSLNRMSPRVQRLLRTVARNRRATANSQQQEQSSSSPGPQGARGDRGEKGEKGDPGASGATGASGADADQPRTIQAGALRGFTLAPKGDNDDATDNGSVTFAAPPVDSTLGTRALRFVSDNGRPVVVYLPLPSGYSPTGTRPLLGELTKASYGSLIDSQPQNALDVSFQIEVVKSTSTRFASGYTTVVYEPYQNGSSETPDEWHRHSVDTGKVWSSSHTSQTSPPSTCVQSNPCTFDEFVTANPNAEVLTVKLRIGQNNGVGWTGFEGFVDDLSYGFGPVTRYDFGG